MALATQALMVSALKAAAQPALISALAPMCRLAFNPALRSFSKEVTVSRKGETDVQPTTTNVYPMSQVFPPFPPIGRLGSVFRDMQREMDALFGNTSTGSLFTNSPSDSLGWPTAAFRLSADVTEDDKNYYVKADVPGMKKEDVKLQLTKDNVLTISAQRNAEINETKDGIHRVERSFGSFARSFQLPDNVDTEQITAETQDGVLKVKIPKLPETTPSVKEIPVN